MRKITLLLVFLLVTFAGFGNDYDKADNEKDAFVYIPTNSFSGTTTNEPTTLNDAATAWSFTQEKFGGSYNTTVTIDVTGNDTFGASGPNLTHPLTFSNGSLTSASASGATLSVGDNGTIGDLSDDVILYTAAVGFSGTDTFNYVITNNDGLAAIGTVTVTVSSFGPVDDVITVDANSTDNIIDVVANDIDGPDNDGSMLIASTFHVQDSTVQKGVIKLEGGLQNVGGMDDKLLYTPPSGFSGIDTYDYFFSSSGVEWYATITINVTPASPTANGTPTAVDDTATATQNGLAVDIDVTGNDNYGTDGPNTNHPLTFANGTTTSASDNGASIEVVGGEVKYTPSATFSGTDTFTYTITDANGDAASATVTVTVGASGQVFVPTANDDAVSVFTNTTSNIIDVLDNDLSGADGYIDGGLTMTNGTLFSASTNGGAISIDNKGTNDTTDDEFLYTPPTGFTGTDTFQYTITDATGDADTATVTVTVEVVTNAPTAGDDSAIVDMNSSNNVINMLVNDSFGSDGPAAVNPIIAITPSTNGGTAVVADNSTMDPSDDTILYTPAAGFAGTDSFTYTLTDATGDTATATVTITVTETPVVNGTPTAVDDTATATQNGLAVDIDVTDNDAYGTDGPNTNHPLTFANGTTTSASDNGASIEVVGGEVKYTPSATFSGTDTFTYTITDANGDAASATVTVTVGASGQVFVPTANDDAVSVFTNTTSNIIDVLDNDQSGADGYIDGGLTMTNGTLFSASTNGGAISIDNKGTNDTTDDEFLYTPPTGFTGTDTFQYTITDATGDADTATVTVTVEVVTDAPTAGDDSAIVDMNSSNNVINMFANDSFGTDLPSSPPFSFSAGLFSGGFYIPSITTGQGGTAEFDNNGTSDTSDDTILYTPAAGFAGTDSFTYYIYDIDGDRDGAIVTVTVTETPVVNGTPTADDDTANATQNGSAVDINVIGNDNYGTDGPNTSHPLTFANGTTTSASDNGASIEVVSGEVRYTPSATFSGTDTFTYTITDANGDAASATVTVTVAGSGEVYVPTADDDTASFDQNSSNNNIDVLGNDEIGADGLISGHGLRLQGGLSQRYTANGGYMVVNDGGTANDSSDDTIDYTPAAGFTGIDTFTYTITDATGDSSTATVTITVTVPKGTSSEANNNFTNSFTIYPNPSRGLVNTQIESASATEALLYVVDVTGKVVYKNNLNLTQGLNNISFTLARAQGVMFIRVIGNNENFGTKKIIFE